MPRPAARNDQHNVESDRFVAQTGFGAQVKLGSPSYSVPLPWGYGFGSIAQRCSRFNLHETHWPSWRDCHEVEFAGRRFYPPSDNSIEFTRERQCRERFAPPAAQFGGLPAFKKARHPAPPQAPMHDYTPPGATRLWLRQPKQPQP